MTNKFLATVAYIAISAAPALAQEVETPVAPPPSNLPINPPPGAVVKSLGNLYIWGDGGAWAVQQQSRDQNAAASEQTQNTAAPSQTSIDPVTGLPTASSATTRGAIGYVLPSDTLSPKLGSNVRTEFGMSQTIANVPVGGGAGPSVYNGVAFGGCSTCGGGGADYGATEMSAKAASDYKFDTLTLTPSVTVYNSQSKQNFSTGSAALEWRDVGAKAGVDAKVDINKQLALGVGGSYGRAMRDVSGSFDSAGIGGSTTPYLANGEAKLTYKAAEDLSFNGYAGLSNYDNKVPGVASTGRVDYAPASNVYYGAGATYHFGTK